MTNEEAINVLRGQESAYWDTLTEAEHKAFDLAVDALTAQQPRVLTLEELIAIGQIWTSNTPPYLFMDINPSIRRTCGFWCAWCDLSDMISGLHPKYTNDNYGIEWRCWTARPTDEQREATPWDEAAEGR